MVNATTPANTTASQASISESNRSRILQHLYHHGVSSRAQIAKALELTPAAITKITARLIEAGVIKETGDIEGSKNRRSIGLKLDTSHFRVIGVKFARSLVQIGVFDLAGNRLSLDNLPTVSNDTVWDTIATIHTKVNDLLANDKRIMAVGMAVPGPYLRGIGRIAVVSSMQEWRKVNFLREFADAFRVPVFLEQDARAGALAEYLFDPDIAANNLAYYLVGEGVGLGAIDNGHLINGALGAATEIGHVSIDVNGRPCDCGNVGCLERYCSASAIHELVNATDGLIPGSADMSHAEACRALFALCDAGDATANHLLRQVARFVGYGCVTIFNAFNPSHIVLGDIVSEAGAPLLNEVRRVVDERVISELNDSTTITLSGLSTDAAVAGAAAVAITQFLEHPSVFFDVT
ncbi:ROK family transcriptional regulator [Bifidobacterium eulemuris]|uniref:NagC family transcriptional regulator n=1 Tax=Bifidobacterium eulemuris TaxID=1765219 RepID=A0A261G7J7_9BIFI|nr:ROK family transcriptional regulator [Bifidobacterium eulemuris]OZG67392.1 NagC family transcriptional regulator [Bifidobacterium eulemuris]QOL32962.1 ROK family transcriptional regulator [Bifidobacterium eulemuris]